MQTLSLTVVPAVYVVLRKWLPDILHFAGSKTRCTVWASFNYIRVRVISRRTTAADGYSNQEIAGRLVISEKTVKNHIANIFSKLQVNYRTQAVLYALRKGLVSMPPEEEG